MEMSIWSHGVEVQVRSDWEDRLKEIARSYPSDKKITTVRDYAEFLLRERWHDPELNRAMLAMSVALWLTDSLGMILLKSVLGAGERIRGVLRRALTEWMTPDLLTEHIVSYDTPIREAIENILYEQDRHLYKDCHLLMEREVGYYLAEKRTKEISEISKAYHTTPQNPMAGIERYCKLYENGYDRHSVSLQCRIHNLSSSQRTRHFTGERFDRFFWFFEGFNAYTNGDKERGLRLLEAVVKADEGQGHSDFPAQVSFHLVGNSYLHGRNANMPRALELVQRAVEIARQQREPGAVVQTLTTLGRVYSKLGELKSAADVLREAVRLSGESKRSSPSTPLCELSDVAFSLGEPEEARRTAEAVLRLEGEPKTKRSEIDRAKRVLARLG